MYFCSGMTGRAVNMNIILYKFMLIIVLPVINLCVESPVGACLLLSAGGGQDGPG